MRTKEPQCAKGNGFGSSASCPKKDVSTDPEADPSHKITRSARKWNEGNTHPNSSTSTQMNKITSRKECIYAGTSSLQGKGLPPTEPTAKNKHGKRRQPEKEKEKKKGKLKRVWIDMHEEDRRLGLRRGPALKSIPHKFCADHSLRNITAKNKNKSTNAKRKKKT